MTNSKYYRVGAFLRSEDSKQIIIQVHDRKEAEAWVPRVKAMLDPERAQKITEEAFLSSNCKSI